HRLDAGPRGGVELLLLDRVGIALLHELGEHFLADLPAEALPHDPGRHLAGAESLDPRRPADLLQARLDLLLDALGGQLDPHAALERAGRLDSDHDGIRILDCSAPPASTAGSVLLKLMIFKGLYQQGTWCERRGSNSHGLPHRILNPARLPIPPLSPESGRHSSSARRCRPGIIPRNRRPPMRARATP